MAENRETGLYWVIKRSIHPDWLVAHWYDNSKLWQILNPKSYYCHTSELDEVGSRILSPKKEPVERKLGFYWVKFNIGDYWTIVYWSDNPKGWHSVGSNRTFTDEDIDKIGPRLSPPEGE